MDDNAEEDMEKEVSTVVVSSTPLFPGLKAKETDSDAKMKDTEAQPDEAKDNGKDAGDI